MNKLSLPECNFTIKKNQDKNFIFDIVRKKYVVLTPEEWVRQHVVHFLISHRNYPTTLIGVEVSLHINKQQKRADIVCYNSNQEASLIVECKAPEVEIKQEVFEQISEYNLFLKAPYLLVTNGIKHAICKIDFELKTYNFIKEIPFYNQEH